MTRKSQPLLRQPRCSRRRVELSDARETGRRPKSRLLSRLERTVDEVSTPVIAGRYLVRGLLGRGATGEVYEVLDTYENDIVALKLLTVLPAGGPWAEAQILRGLADPHILPIRNADLASGRPYLVTELATHGSLDQRLGTTGQCGLDVDDVVRWIRQACHGVARAHACGCCTTTSSRQTSSSTPKAKPSSVTSDARR